VPGKKVVWRVLQNEFNFIKDKTEWNGTDVIFDITKKGDKTEVCFTHAGLVPAYEGLLLRAKLLSRATRSGACRADRWHWDQHRKALDGHRSFGSAGTRD
jgi:hypothetical protein